MFTKRMDTLEPKKEVIEAMQERVSYQAAYCYACGAKFPSDDLFCGKCGQPRRSNESIGRLSMALQKDEPLCEIAIKEDDAPLTVLEKQGGKAAIQAMTGEYYKDKKQRISIDACHMLVTIYHPYIAAFTDIKPNSEEGKIVRCLGEKLNELEGWVGMIKTYNNFRKADPAHQGNLAELWSGIGEWSA